MRTTLSASYRNMTAARRAIDVLQYGGIDPADIRLLGAAVDAARRSDEHRDMTRRDVPLLWRVFWRGILWSIIGSPVGALIGVALVLAGFEVINWWLTVLVWALFGHLIGGMWGAYAALGIGDAWETTFADAEGLPVVVAVSASSAADASRAERLLRTTDVQAIDTATHHGG